MSVVIIRLTVLTHYVWIAVTGESGRSYLKAWLEALGEDRARRLPTRSPTSADPSTRRSSTSSRLGGTCDEKAKLCSIPLEDKQAVLLPLREFMLARCSSRCTVVRTATTSGGAHPPLDMRRGRSRRPHRVTRV